MKDTTAPKAQLPTHPSSVDQPESCDGPNDGVIDAATTLLSFKKPRTALPISPRPARVSLPPPASTSETSLNPGNLNQVSASSPSPYSRSRTGPIPTPILYKNHTAENNVLPSPPGPNFNFYFDDYIGSGPKHDTWTKVSIKTAKCDHCCGRNRSVLQRCDDCSRQVCKECMRTFPSEDIHFVDPDHLDWHPDSLYFYRRHSRQNGREEEVEEGVEEAIDDVDMVRDRKDSSARNSPRTRS